MPDVCICFEVHQPFRVSPSIRRGDPSSYFDDAKNRGIFERVARKCYYPASRIILEEIERAEGRFKVGFSLSGTFVEQCKMYDPELLQLFVELRKTGCVEFLCQTYYHSLASLYEDKDEFVEQIRMHEKLMKDEIGYSPTFFENTELLYNNEIAKIAENLGFVGIFAEGVDRVLGWRSPNYVYKPPGLNIKVLLRNYQLTDDIGFRFSSTRWEEYPLTADKYATWLSVTPGQCINLFMDYETFGEHHWPESGIHEFLRHLPREVLKRGMRFLTPTEVVREHQAVGEVDVPINGTTSWADLARDTSCWLGNEMQRICFEKIKMLTRIHKGEYRKIVGYLQSSDHLHYLYTGGGGPGEVHSYFRPFDDAIKAFVFLYAVLVDLEYLCSH